MAPLERLGHEVVVLGHVRLAAAVFVFLRRAFFFFRFWFVEACFLCVFGRWRRFVIRPRIVGGVDGSEGSENGGANDTWAERRPGP